MFFVSKFVCLVPHLQTSFIGVPEMWESMF